jgi:uncharacterized membrane protein YhaH (DUF805 family)
MAEQMGSIMGVGLAVNLVMASLLAASFVRRLHDSDHSGLWAAPAVATQHAATIFNIAQIDQTKNLVVATMNPLDLAVYPDSQMALLDG